MSRIVRIAETIHLLTVGLWLGALVMGGVVAAIIFPTMRELDPTLALFESYDGAHADLGAGYIQARVFFAVDMLQFVGAFVGGIALAISIFLRHALRTRAAFVRSLLFAAAVLAFAYQFFVLTPRMDRNAQDYWRAAQAGEIEAAERSRDAFSADHPTATRVFGLIGVLVLGSFVASAWTVTQGSTTTVSRDGADA